MDWVSWKTQNQAISRNQVLKLIWGRYQDGGMESICLSFQLVRSRKWTLCSYLPAHVLEQNGVVISELGAEEGDSSREHKDKTFRYVWKDGYNCLYQCRDDRQRLRCFSMEKEIYARIYILWFSSEVRTLRVKAFRNLGSRLNSNIIASPPRLPAVSTSCLS